MKLVVEHVAGARRGARQIFEPDERVRFGRHPECEVAFDPEVDRDASSRHAEIVREGPAVVLVDQGSANGTLVGGARVTKVTLPPGVPVLVEFGGGGPACRITLGDPDTLLPATMLQRGGGKTGAHTAIQKAVDVVLAQRGRRLRLALIGLGAALVATIVMVVVFTRGGAADRRESERLRQEMEQARRDAELRRAADEDARKVRDRALAEGPGPAIVRENRDVVYLLASVDPGSEAATPFCTAFAASPTTLATNAHCVRVLYALRAEGKGAFAVASGGGRRVPLGDAQVHPDYVERTDRASWDVGTISAGEPLPRAARLAPAATAQALSAGARIFTYGFPSRLADPARAEATLTEGVIGRVTTLQGTPGTAAESVLVQHSAFTTGGTSGSPVFDASGTVIAINAGGLRDRDNVDSGASLPGYNVAIRIDALETLMQTSSEREREAPAPR